MAVMSSHQLEGAILDQKVQAKMASEGEQKVNGVNGHPSPKSPEDIVPDEPDSTTAAAAANDAPKENGNSTPEASTEKDTEAFASNQDVPNQSNAMDVDEPDAKTESTPAPDTLDAKNAADDDAIMTDADEDKPESKVQSTVAKSADVEMKEDALDPDSQPATTAEPVSSAEHPDPSSTQNTSVISDGAAVAAKEAAPKEQSTLPAPSASEALKSPAKVPREREDDNVEEPASKRVKTDPPEPASSEAASAAPAGQGEADAPPAKQDDWKRYDDPERDNAELTPNMVRDAKRAIAGIKKTKMGEKLCSPVWVNWPEIKEPYLAIVKSPMDFGALEKKLKEGQYKTLRELKDDATLIYANCCQFNGVHHAITQQAHGYVERVMDALKSASHDKSRSHRKEVRPAAPQSAKRQTEPRATTQKPRRESVATPVSPTPKSAGETPFFAPAPSGMPLIRRDPSNQEDKRPIVPPKNKDLEYTNKNQKKKLSVEMKFYEEVLNELQSPKHYEINNPFLTPVDPVALNIPTYFQVIKKPMDLSTISQRIDAGHYKKGKEVEADLSLMFKNCYKFNPVGNAIHEVGKQLEDMSKQLLADKDAWMKKNAPPPPPPKPARKVQESESEESEAEEAEQPQEDSADIKTMVQTIKALETRVKEEADKISKEIAKANPDESVVNVGQILLTTLQNQLVQEKKKLIEVKKHVPAKPKPAKPAKAAKPSAPAAPKKKESQGKKPPKKKAAKTKRGEPTELHRNVVTDGILLLGEADMNTCIEIIKKDTSQTENDSGELELDITVLSADAVWELFDIISAKLPHIAEARMSGQAPEHVSDPEPSPPRQVAKAAKPKKAKPMNKQEQEARIEQLKNLKAQFQRQGSGSQEPIPSVEDLPQQDDSSDESADSEEE